MIPPEGRFSVAERVALVTGGSRGIGRAIAQGLADAGAAVALVARDATTLAEAARAVPRSITVVADVTDEAQVEAAVREVADRLERIDILINAAGVSPVYRKAEQLESDDWRTVISTNLTGTFLCCRAVGRLMLEAGRGSIVNVSSIGGTVGLSRLAAYSASKGGVEALTRTLALEWAPRGVRVNALAPAFISTELTRGMIENAAIRNSLIQQTPLGRIGDVEDIVGPAIFLASDAARYVTGHTLLVDGGWTAR